MSKKKVDIKKVVRDLSHIVKAEVSSNEISSILESLGHKIKPSSVRSIRAWCTIESRLERDVQ